MGFRKLLAMKPPALLGGYYQAQYMHVGLFSTGGSSVANRVYLQPLWVPASCIVKNVGSNLPGAGNHFDVGVYSSTFARIASLGSTVNVPGLQTWTAGWALPAGALWLAWVSDAIATNPGASVFANRSAPGIYKFQDGPGTLPLPAQLTPSEASGIAVFPPFFSLNVSAF